MEGQELVILEEAAMASVNEELTRGARIPDPGQGGSFNITDMDNLKKRHTFLNEYSKEDFQKYSLETLLKLEATSIKLKNLEANKAAEARLAGNRDSLEDTFYKVPEGTDNRWTELHDSRFLPGWGCSSQKMWSKGREVLKNNGHPAIATYDMASVGLAGHVTNQGWVALHDPGNSNLALRMFSINNCGRRVASKQGDNEDSLLSDIIEFGELTLAMRVLKEAVSFVRPWDKSIAALDGFLHQTGYCKADLDHLDKKAEILTQFVDYVLKENSNRWKGRENFLSITELKGTWESFFGSRPQGQLAKNKQAAGKTGVNSSKNQGGQQQQQSQNQYSQGQQQQQGNNNRIRVPQVLFSEDICVMFNLGKCTKPANYCSTKAGKKLKHICNWRPYGNMSLPPCGVQHAAIFYH